MLQRNCPSSVGKSFNLELSWDDNSCRGSSLKQLRIFQYTLSYNQKRGPIDAPDLYRDLRYASWRWRLKTIYAPYCSRGVGKLFLPRETVRWLGQEVIHFTLAISSEEDSNPSTQEVGAVNSNQLPAPARISANSHASWSSSLQVSWKGEDCGKVNEFLLSSDNVSLPLSKSRMDTFLTPPFSSSTLCRILKTAEKDLVPVMSSSCNSIG